MIIYIYIYICIHISRAKSRFGSFCHDICQFGFLLRMQAYDKAKAAKVWKPQKHVESLGLRGYYRCCIYAWRKVRVADKWPLLCEACPKLAMAYKEVPNVLRELLGKRKKLEHRLTECGEDSMMPFDFESAVVECVATWLQSRWGSFLETDGMHDIYIYIYIYRERERERCFCICL